MLTSIILSTVILAEEIVYSAWKHAAVQSYHVTERVEKLRTPLNIKIDEERGIVWYRQVSATTDRSSRTKGDLITDPRTGINNYDEGYAAADQKAETLGTGDGAATNFAGNVVQFPVRPHTVSLIVDGKKGMDDGEGNILGQGFSGTFNYETGVFSIDFATAPANGVVVAGSYTTDFEAQEDIQGITGGLASTDVIAEVYALKSEAGLLSEYAFQKRFGRMAQDEVAQDLTSELTRTLNAVAVSRLNAASTGTPTTWDKAPPSGVSYAEHKLTFIDALANAEQAINNNAGRGNISRMIAGSKACATLRGMPGFTPVEGSVNYSVGLYGYLNGTPVIRGSQVLADNRILCIYKGLGMLESPMVHAPYMPLFVSDTVSAGRNPLRHQRVSAVWCAMKSVIPTFVHSLDIQNA